MKKKLLLTALTLLLVSCQRTAPSSTSSFSPTSQATDKETTSIAPSSTSSVSTVAPITSNTPAPITSPTAPATVSTPISSSKDTSSPSSTSEKPLHSVITLNEEMLGMFASSTYYGPLGKLTFFDKGIQIEGEEETYVFNYYNYDPETAPILYVFREKAEYRLSLTKEKENDHYTLHLDEINGEDKYENVAVFMPSVKEYTGYYTGIGDGDIQNLGYSFSDDFSYQNNGFLVSVGNSIHGHFFGNFFLRSYYVLKDNGYILQASLVDTDDYDFLSEHQLTKTSDKITLGDEELLTEAGFLRGTFYSLQSKEVTFTMDDSATTLSFSGNENLPLTAHTDKGGSYYTYTLNGTVAILRPTPYGFTREINGQTEEFVYEEKQMLLGTYQYESTVFSLQEDSETNGYTLTLNGKEVDYSLSVYHHKLALEVKSGSDTYLFISNAYQSNLLCSLNGKDVYFINYENYRTVFHRSYYGKTMDSSLAFSIDDSLKISYEGETVQGYLSYDGSQEYVTYHFTHGSIDYTLDIFYLNNLIFQLRSASGINQTVFDKDVIESYYKEYTSNGSKDLTLHQDKITIDSAEYDYSLESVYYARTFSSLISVEVSIENTVKHYILNGYSDILLLENGNMTKDYIPYTEYEKLIGTYVYTSHYGEERLYVEEGRFYADTVNSTSDGLEKKKQFNFTLSMSLNTLTQQYVPVISFEGQSNVFINCYLSGGSLLVFGNKYVREEIYQRNGVYTDTSNVYYLHEDVLEVNGTAVTIQNYIYNEDSLVLETLGETYTFSTVDGTKQARDGTLTLKEKEIDYASFVNSYSVQDGNTTYTLEFAVVTDPVTGHNSYKGKINNTTYDFTWVYYNNKLSMKFTVLFDTYYLSLEEDGTLTLSHAGASLPPIPPAPPVLH